MQDGARRRSFDSLPALKRSLEPMSAKSNSKSRGTSMPLLWRLAVQLWTRHAWPYLRIAFGGDKRSAALFRVALAITVLGDVVDRAHDLSAHYTDAGVLPRRVALEKFANATWLSFHMWGGGWWPMALAFALHLAAAAAMLVGWHARKAALAVWVMTTSLQVRNILVLHSGDVLLRVSLFWALFLPLGDVFSIDAAFKNYNEKTKTKGRGISAKKHAAAGQDVGDDASSTASSILGSILEPLRGMPSSIDELESKEANDHSTTATSRWWWPTPQQQQSSGRYAFINAGTLAVLLQVRRDTSFFIHFLIIN
jgi:hypothetical protein